MTPPVGPPRRWWRSTRARFELLTLTLVALVIGALVLVQALRIQRGLTADLVSELDSELEEITRIAETDPGLLKYELEHERAHFSVMLVLAANGTPRWPVDVAPALVVFCQALRARAPAGVQREQWSSPDAASPMRLVFGPMGGEWLCLGRSEAPIQAATSRFRLTGLGLGLVAVTVLWIGIHRIAAGVFRPIAQITDRASHLSAQRLSERVPVTGTGDELDRLAVLLNAMLERLERSFQSLVRFTTHASHQLRTPLAAIRLAAERALASGTAEDATVALDETLEEVVRLQTLVRALLEMARGDASEPLQLQATSLGALAVDTVALVRPLAEARSIVISCEAAEPITVQADATLLREALTALVENALQYTPDAGTIQVTVSAAAGAACVRVADSGVGVPVDERDHIFEPFFRGRLVQTLAPGGHGLGLPMAAAIARRHGGSVELVPNAQAGACFELRLPRAPSPQPRPAAAAR